MSHIVSAPSGRAPLRRRTLLPLLAAGLAAPSVLARPAAAAAAATAAQTAAWETPRTLGKADAKFVVEEWFSLTCTALRRLLAGRPSPRCARS